MGCDSPGGHLQLREHLAIRMRFSRMSIRANSQVWTEEDTQRLREHIARGGSVIRASVIFKRSQAALRAHASSLGLKFPTIKDLRRKATGSERYSAE
jgi:hypothetical protein